MLGKFALSLAQQHIRLKAWILFVLASELQ